MLYNIIMMITCAPQLCYYTYINSAIYSYGELTECLSYNFEIESKENRPRPLISKGCGYRPGEENGIQEGGGY